MVIDYWMQQQQGFCRQGQFQLVEVECVPTFTAKPYKPKQYSHQLKLKVDPPPDPSVFIDQELQDHLRENFRTKHHKKLIYQVCGNSKQQSQQREGLLFESNYENANLEYVTSEDLKHYELYIKADTNTKQHFQWFCFRVSNGEVRKATLTIKNFLKSNMLYKQGLRPYCRSTKAGHKHHEQLNTEVVFELSQEEEDNEYYELTFQLSFNYLHDQLQICSQPPYTHARLQKTFKNSLFNRVSLAKSILGHSIDAFLLNDHDSCKAVTVVLARQHPGESVSSWLVEGLAGRLMELNCPEVMWVIVPMVNVDGVVLGNNRTGLLGYDFNRHWYIDKDTNRSNLFPELMGIIRYFKRRQKEWSRKVKIFLDLHGHSSQPNVFAFGPPHHKTSEHYDNSRLLPYLIHSKNPDFSVKQSSFEIEANKKHCARSVFFGRLGFHYSYTIESSFGIYNHRKINESDLLTMGRSICEATLEFAKYLSNPNRTKHKLGIEELMRNARDLGEGNGAVQDDSGSEEEDASSRDQFQHKIVELLAEKSATKGLKLGSSVQLSHKADLNSPDKQLSIKASSFRFRFKTDHVKNRDEVESRRESSLFLPRIKAYSRSRQHTAQSTCPDTSFSNMSLNEIRQKLYCIRNSKFGKKLLIGSRGF